MAYSISLSTESITFPAMIESTNSGQTITVTTNGNTDSDCYYIMTDIQWATFERNGGTVRIIPTSNTSNFEREGYVVFYNKADEQVFAILEILQEYIEYSVSPDQLKIQFQDIVEAAEEKEIKITVRGGRKRFYVNAINEYSEDGVRLVYDKAFKITFERQTSTLKESIYKLKIKSYGIITAGARYELILSHSDRRDVTAQTIHLTFEQSTYEVPTIRHKDFLYCEQ